MIDMQTYLSLGTVVIFSIIVPGVLLTATTLVVRHNALNISSYELFASVVIYGFLANIFGHFLGLLHRRLQKKYKEIPFQVIYTQSYDLPKEKAVLLRKDGEYWFGIYTLYWNVAWGLPFIVLFYFKYLSLLHLAILLVSFILLLTLSISILDNLIQLQPTTAAMIKRSMYRISLVDKHISLLRASDIDAVAKILANKGTNRGIWYHKTHGEMSEVLTTWLNSLYCVCLVYKLGDKIIGFARLDQYKHETRKHVAGIGPIAIDNHYHRRGIGTSLVSELVTLAKQLTITRLEVKFPLFNEGIRRILKKTGFTLESTQQDAFYDYVDKKYTAIEQWILFL